MSITDGSRTAPGILAALDAVREELTEAIPPIESARRLPPDVVELMRATGAFAMVMPRDPLS